MSFTVKSYLHKLAYELKENEIASPYNEAQLILMNVLNVSKEKLIMQFEEPLTQQTQQKTEELYNRRILGEPLSKIINLKAFWKSDFYTNQYSLDPRPDSESLIELCLKLYENSSPNNILELGVGTGCLVISLLQEFPDSKANAVDINENTLNVAEFNAEKLAVSDRINIYKSNWFSEIDKANQFDLIISNPPYIKLEQLKDLPREVNFDPALALNGGEDGLEAYRQIAHEAFNYMNRDSYLVLELGEEQFEEVNKIFQNHYKLLEYKTDLNNIIRAVCYQKAI